jgi:uncharacterized protein with LGFP repeats
VTGALLAAYTAVGGTGGPLGSPTSDQGATPDGKASYQHFQEGSIYVTAAHGARVLPTVIRDYWASSGWELGPLGYPSGDATVTSDGRATVQDFEGGQVYASTATGAHAVPASLASAYQTAGGESGGLGLPVIDGRTTPDKRAAYQHFEGGSIYSTAATGAHAVPTLLRDAWAASGWENGPLGYPSADAMTLPDGIGRYQQFQKGSVYWSPSSGAHVLFGPVYGAWAATGLERGMLGYPTRDVATAPDGKGRFAYFRGGAIYWSSTTGAHIVRGAVLDAWASTGWEQGPLGYPTSDAVLAVGGRTTFQHGVIQIAADGAAAVVVR